MISYIIPTRNDNHQGDSTARAARCLSVLRELQPDSEIIVVDWGSEIPLADAIRRRFSPSPENIRYICVPPKVANQFPANVFPEVIMFNVGIVRAKGTWIAPLEADVLIGDRYARFTNGLDSRPAEGVGCAYESLRRSMLTATANPTVEECPVWPGGVRGEQPWPIDCEYYWRGARGILLAPTWAWMKTRGYDERLTGWQHTEHDLCLRFKNLCGLVNLGVITNCDFYHQWHELTAGRPHNEDSWGAIYRDPAFKVCATNPETWGYSDQDFPEIHE